MPEIFTISRKQMINFRSVGHFFQSLFGDNGELAHKILLEAGSIANLAQPIVKEIETELKAQPNQGHNVQAIEKFLGRYEPNAEKVAHAAQSVSGLQGADLWKNLAVIALQTLVPGGAAASLLNLGVELAYSIHKRSKAVPEPVSTPA